MASNGKELIMRGVLGNVGTNHPEEVCFASRNGRSSA